MPSTAKAALTTPGKQKADAAKAAGHDKPRSNAAKDKVPESKEVERERKAAEKAKAAERAARVAKWRDTNGVELVKGVTVKHDGKTVGTVSYRHTHHDDKGKEIGMVGVALTGKGDALSLNGRTVKNRSYKAADLTAVAE